MLPTAGHAPTAALGPESDRLPRLPDHMSGGPPMDFFLFTFSAKDLTVDAEGYLVAIPCKLLERAGLNGVTSRRGIVHRDGAILKHQKAGRVVLPDDFPVVAFDKKIPTVVNGRPVCAYRTKHTPDIGKPQYHDCWQKYEQDLDGTWYLDVDADGYMKFLRDVAAWLNPQPHHLRALTERLHLEGRRMKADDIKIAGQEPKKRTTRKAQEG